MKNNFLIILICLTAVFTCGFESGIEVENSTDKPDEPAKPVLSFEKTTYPKKSSKERYLQYHLLVVSSLEEAEVRFGDNRRWAYRMAHNAYNYLRLMEGLLKNEHKKEIIEIKEQLKPVVDKIKKANLTTAQTNYIKDQLQQIAEVIDKSYSIDKVKRWIKN